MATNVPADNPMNALVLTAMMNALDQKAREELLQKALLYIITQRDDPHRYGQKQDSPLEQAFKFAVERIARDIIDDMVKNDESIRARIKALCAQAAEKLFINADEISSAMARSMADAISKRY